VRRASVTQIAQVLQNHGIIHYSHGKLAILDLTGLEARACGCFAKMKERYDRAVGKIDFGFCKPSFSQR
jgi:hypothetical protein